MPPVLVAAYYGLYGACPCRTGLLALRVLAVRRLDPALVADGRSA